MNLHIQPRLRQFRRRAVRLILTASVLSGALLVVGGALAHRAEAQAAPTTSAVPVTTGVVQPLPSLPGAVANNQRTSTSPASAGVVGALPTSVPSTGTYPVLAFDNPFVDQSAQTTANVSISVGDPAKPSQSVLIILLLTLLSLAPSLLILLTSFTRIAIVLSLVRNALGLQSIPPNQVIVGLALFLSLFVMKPTFEQINTNAIKPLMRGEKTQGQAYDAAIVPLRTFMLKQTGKRELKMMIGAAKEAKPRTTADVSTTTLIPAFILSELRIAFIIGFVIFIPFLVIDLVVSSSLMSMGMMMLPPVTISLPFKLLLFVMVDGWALVVKSLITSFG